MILNAVTMRYKKLHDMAIPPFIWPAWVIPFVFTINLNDVSGPIRFRGQNAGQLPVELVVRYKELSGQRRASRAHGFLPGERVFLG